MSASSSSLIGVHRFGRRFFTEAAVSVCICLLIGAILASGAPKWRSLQSTANSALSAAPAANIVEPQLESFTESVALAHLGPEPAAASKVWARAAGAAPKPTKPAMTAAANYIAATAFNPGAIEHVLRPASVHRVAKLRRRRTPPIAAKRALPAPARPVDLAVNAKRTSRAKPSNVFVGFGRHILGGLQQVAFLPRSIAAGVQAVGGKIAALVPRIK